MPDKSLSVATYAAGASLAAIALVYVFGPTYLLDNEQSSGPLSSLTNRKKGVVGLVNPANDCFINSVLQALAGLGDLRLYLIRETHRRNIDEVWVYAQPVPENAEEGDGTPQSPRRPVPSWKTEGLQRGIVTKGLKEILDQLNERPIYKKTVTALPFVHVLESAFRQRISRQQQDAQEFLQIVAERICDEYHAGSKARNYAKRKASEVDGSIKEQIAGSNQLEALREGGLADTLATESRTSIRAIQATQAQSDPADDEYGFPMEGKIESQVECQTCSFKPQASQQTFCTLTLNVPQSSATTLNACFDGLFKTEFIDEYKCDKCRLVHARGILEKELAKATTEKAGKILRSKIAKLQLAIDTDPENPPEDVELPDLRHAPKQRIAKHTRLTRHPKILAIHLSRSIYDSSQMSQKNSAKVSFPERLPLGGLLDQRKYKLLGTVTHKGSHHSGHYESFRRQNAYPPYSNPNTFRPSMVYSRSASPAMTPRLQPQEREGETTSTLPSSPDLLSPTNASTTSLASSTLSRGGSTRDSPANSAQTLPTIRQVPGLATKHHKEKDADSISLRSITRSTLSKIAPSRPGSRSASTRVSISNGDKLSSPGSPQLNAGAAAAGPSEKAQAVAKPPRSRKAYDKWWRISDEKVKEASTRDVLGMQREVYLLFYELERDEPPR